MHKTKITPYLLMLPFFVFFIVFKLIPVLITISNGIWELDSSTIILFQQMKFVFEDQLFFKTLANTVLICCFYIGIKIPIVIVLANLANKIKHRKIFLMILYAPTIIGMYAYAILFRYLFTYNGIINQQLKLLGFTIDWFGNSFFAQLMIALTLIWGTLGFYVLLYHNALKNIPKELDDVIRLETNKYLPKLIYLQLPQLYPVLKSILFMAVLEVVTLVDIPISLTQGGPNQSTITISYYVYLQAIQYNNFAYASFVGIVVSIIVLLIFLTRRNIESFKYEVS